MCFRWLSFQRPTTITHITLAILHTHIPNVLMSLLFSRMLILRHFFIWFRMHSHAFYFVRPLFSYIKRESIWKHYVSISNENIARNIYIIHTRWLLVCRYSNIVWYNNGQISVCNIKMNEKENTQLTHTPKKNTHQMEWMRYLFRVYVLFYKRIRRRRR